MTAEILCLAYSTAMKSTFVYLAYHRFFLLLIAIALSEVAIAKAQQAAPKVLVSTAERTKLIEEIPISGSVVSPRVAELALEVSGIIDKMSVDIGDQVQTSDKLLQLNADLHKLSLASARAASEQGREQLEDAKRRLDNFQALAKQNTVSENELQSLAAQVRIDKAALDGLIAEEKRQQTLLQRHTLKAPFAGVISRKHVEEGEWIQPGNPAFTLVANADLRLDFRLPQTLFSKLDQIQDITITLDSLPQQTFRGRIEAVVPVTSPDSRTFLARIALDNQQVSITPGMSASAILRLQQSGQGVVVPRDALLRYPDGRVTVWIVKSQNDAYLVTEQQVQTGLSFDGKISISHGLSGGEKVVVQGNEALREGQAVVVQSVK